MENKLKEHLLQKLVTEKWSAGWQFSTKKHDKIHKVCRNGLRVFALRNYSESYKINKPLSGLLLYRRIMPKAERLSKKIHSWPRSEVSRAPVKFWGQSLRREQYPPIYQPAKGVHPQLPNIHNLHNLLLSPIFFTMSVMPIQHLLFISCA